MSHRGVMVGLTQAALLGLGVAGASGQIAGAISNAPVPLVTNLVAQRVVRDAIQTLLEVGPGLSRDTGSCTNWQLAAQRAREAGHVLITNTFAGFVPGTLASVVWAGFHTNGRSTRMWEVARMPPGWPSEPPVLRWNTNSLLWGRKGMTAISQAFEGMGAFGQGAITALTPRHGYARGHHMGPSGLQPQHAGRRIWFCTRDNRLVERRIQFLLVRGGGPDDHGDYSIILFDEDLPPEIEPMRVVERTTLNRKYFFGDMNHKPLFWALQGGFVSGGIPGWKVDVHGGDSGSPIMLPLPDEVVFIGGITTSPPSHRMQMDMDLLTIRAGLDPSRYQMRWLKLTSYPDF